MDFIQITLLAIIQGLTEFLPVSSSAHLVLVPELLHWPDQGLVFDVAVHLGTLLAVMLYFRHALYPLPAAMLASLRGRSSEHSRLGWTIVIATLPVVFFGFLLKDWVSEHGRNAIILAITSIFFGLVLALADRNGGGQRSSADIGWRDALLIGLAQALAIIPGTSRSGITISAALFLGLDRASAARFSFLLSIPTISASALLVVLDLIQGKAAIVWFELLAGMAIAAVSAYFCIHFFIRLVERTGLMPYVVYRVALGVFLLWWFL